IVMKGGRLMASGHPAQLYRQPPNAYTARLLAKSNILNAEEARQLGIPTDSSVAIHPEWLSVTGNKQGRFTVRDIQFKGFYQLVTIVHDTDVALHAIVGTSAGF